MKNAIKVLCENTSSTFEVEIGTPLVDICEKLLPANGRRFLAAYVNNRIKELNYRVYTPISVRFIDQTHFEGCRVYNRTAMFMLQKAVSCVAPENKLHIRHQLGDGYYCEIDGMTEVTADTCRLMLDTMRTVAAADYTIERSKVLTQEAIAEYEQRDFADKAELMHTRPRLYSNVYRMDDSMGFFFGALAPSTGYIRTFDIRPFYKGFYLALPSRLDPDSLGETPQLDKMLAVFHNYQSWVNIMGVPTVGCVNRKILQGDAGEMIKIAEALHSRRLSHIADMICEANRTRGVKLVLISGPSSSGKTTTAKRLGIQLRVLGFNPALISLDDYFVPRDQTPRDENGDYDYEALEAIDLAQLNDHLRRLTAGESVDIPRYDFITGTRQWHNNPLKLDDRSILILEGIHGLNPRLTPSIPDSEKFRIFASCFTSVAMDNISCIPITDNRLLRRLTRDYATRGSDALATLSRWRSVRRGEEKHIIPYQENADVMFNSSLLYEIAVLRPIVEPILREVPDTVPEYGEAERLLKFLDNFTPITDISEIPPTSVLREFVGGSSFKY